MTHTEYLNANSGATRDEQRRVHREYFAQFVSPAVKHAVANIIGRDAILNSTDEHFNDIPLKRWDNLEPLMKSMCLSKMGDVNGAVSVGQYGQRRISWSLSDAVCIAKEAAKQIKEGI